jgi:hypothetical protein
VSPALPGESLTGGALCARSGVAMNAPAGVGQPRGKRFLSGARPPVINPGQGGLLSGVSRRTKEEL